MSPGHGTPVRRALLLFAVLLLVAPSASACSLVMREDFHDATWAGPRALVTGKGYGGVYVDLENATVRFSPEGTTDPAGTLLAYTGTIDGPDEFPGPCGEGRPVARALRLTNGEDLDGWTGPASFVPTREAAYGIVNGHVVTASWNDLNTWATRGFGLPAGALPKWLAASWDGRHLAIGFQWASEYGHEGLLVADTVTGDSLVPALDLAPAGETEARLVAGAFSADGDRLLYATATSATFRVDMLDLNVTATTPTPTTLLMQAEKHPAGAEIVAYQDDWVLLHKGVATAATPDGIGWNLGVSSDGRAWESIAGAPDGGRLALLKAPSPFVEDSSGQIIVRDRWGNLAWHLQGNATGWWHEPVTKQFTLPPWANQTPEPLAQGTFTTTPSSPPTGSASRGASSPAIPMAFAALGLAALCTKASRRVMPK